MITKLEKKILKRLYSEYKSTKKLPNWKCTESFKELNLQDGSYIGTVNNSKYIKKVLKGTHEYWTITDQGIRYMENQPTTLNKIWNFIKKVIPFIKDFI